MRVKKIEGGENRDGREGRNKEKEKMEHEREILTYHCSASLSWIKTFYARLGELAPNISFGINFSLNEMEPNDPRVVEVIENLDYIMDEAGFTGWGFGKPTPAGWEEISTWIDEIQAHGKQYQRVPGGVEFRRVVCS